MQKLYTLKIGWAIALFVLLDIFCVGLGMGVPFFCILLGLPVGWYLVRRATMERPFATRQVLSRVLVGAAFTSAITFIGMALLWGPWAAKLFDPSADLTTLGAPLILFEPVASFIGWLVLMIVIAPFLQLLMTLFGAHLTLLWCMSQSSDRAV